MLRFLVPVKYIGTGNDTLIAWSDVGQRNGGLRNENEDTKEGLVKKAIIIVFSVLAAVPFARGQSRETVRYPFSAHGEITVENVHGSIHVAAWDKPSVALAIVKTAPTGCDCLDDASVAVARGPGYLAFVTVYSNRSKTPVRVDYVLEVPRQAKLKDLNTLDGTIEVEGVEGGIAAQTLKGDIRETSVAGPIRNRALNGSILASLAKLDAGQGRVSLQTVTGSIRLALPARAGANLWMSTVAGKIETPAGVALVADRTDGTYRTQLQGGGDSILLSTVRGNIRVEEH